MDGKLIEHFLWEKYFTETSANDPVGFDELYDAMSKWAIGPENTILTYEDFAAAELGTKVAKTVDELK